MATKKSRKAEKVRNTTATRGHKAKNQDGTRKKNPKKKKPKKK